ncbi:MAG: hypothetical protein V4440_14755 [Pseudomonadota bacterium]
MMTMHVRITNYKPLHHGDKLYLANPDQSARIAELTEKVTELDGMLGKRNLSKEAEYLAKLAELQATNANLVEQVKKAQLLANELECFFLNKARGNSAYAKMHRLAERINENLTKAGE